MLDKIQIELATENLQYETKCLFVGNELDRRMFFLIHDKINNVSFTNLSTIHKNNEFPYSNKFVVDDVLLDAINYFDKCLNIPLMEIDHKCLDGDYNPIKWQIQNIGNKFSIDDVTNDLTLWVFTKDLILNDLDFGIKSEMFINDGQLGIEFFEINQMAALILVLGKDEYLRMANEHPILRKELNYKFSTKETFKLWKNKINAKLTKTKFL